MTKALKGLAAAALLAALAVPAAAHEPANNDPGLRNGVTTEISARRYHRYRGYYRPYRYGYRYGPYWGAYAYEPAPYYYGPRYYYRPAPWPFWPW